MKTNTKTLSILIAAAGVAVLAFTLTTSSAAKKSGSNQTPVAPAPVLPAETVEDTIQVALLLDTSSSMSGLINQARTQLWKLVNEMSEAKRAGRRPRLQLALYEYGKPSLGADSGFIRQLVPFTDDLDRVSEQLFALTTNGGDEYAGHVIQTATHELAWSARAEDLKLIFIAGNEGFDQGTVDYREAIAQAKERGIVVNTIYCGRADDSVRSGWQHAAMLAGGRSLEIDHNQAIVHIAAPQDAEIAALGAKLNDTYIGYGARGVANEARQMAQDGNAAMSGSLVARSISKASSAYNNADWDLVDGLEQGAVEWAKLSDEELSEDLRAMSANERKAYVEGKREERKQLQARIRTLQLERDKFIAEKQAEMGEAGKHTLDAAMLDVLGELARAKGYELE